MILAALDIGPETAQQFAGMPGQCPHRILGRPMGVSIRRPFAAGTIAVAKSVAAVKFGLTRSKRSRLAGCAWSRRRI